MRSAKSINSMLFPHIIPKQLSMFMFPRAKNSFITYIIASDFLFKNAFQYTSPKKPKNVFCKTKTGTGTVQSFLFLHTITQPPFHQAPGLLLAERSKRVPRSTKCGGRAWDFWNTNDLTLCLVVRLESLHQLKKIHSISTWQVFCLSFLCLWNSW